MVLINAVVEKPKSTDDANMKFDTMQSLINDLSSIINLCCSQIKRHLGLNITRLFAAMTKMASISLLYLTLFCFILCSFACKWFPEPSL